MVCDPSMDPEAEGADLTFNVPAVTEIRFPIWNFAEGEGGGGVVGAAIVET